MIGQTNHAQLHTWEQALKQSYGLDDAEVESLLSKLPDEIKLDNEKTKKFLNFTKLFFETTNNPLFSEEKGWDDKLDGTCAAPESHVVLSDNAKVRILQVTVQPGKKEPFHTHKWNSIMVVAQKSQLIYYTVDSSRQSNPPVGVYQLKPEELHAVENTGDNPFVAYRFEIKNALPGVKDE